MRKGYKLLSAAGLLAAVALTVFSAEAQGAVSPQRFKSQSKNSKGNSFWFPALYSEALPSGDIYVKDGSTYAKIEAGADATAFEELAYELQDSTTNPDDGKKTFKNPSNPAGYWSYDLQVVEPSAFAFKVKITKAASADGKTPGEVTIESAEVNAGSNNPIKMGWTTTIPEFVWATITNTDNGETYLVYKVTAVEPTVFSFLAAEPEKDDSELKAFYFETDKSRLVYDEEAADGDGDTKEVKDITGKLASIYVSPAVPAISGSLKFYGILDGEGKIVIAPTRYVGGTADEIKKGSGFFNGDVKGAKEVADLLKFGLSGDLRDKSVSKTDLERLVTALDSKGYGQLEQTKTTPKFYYKTSGLELHLDGGVTDKVPFAVAIEDGAFTAAGLGDAFASFNFGAGLKGNLGTAGFGSLSVTGEGKLLKAAADRSPAEYVKGFTNITFSDDNDGKEHNKLSSKLEIKGDGLFAGHKIENLDLPVYIDEIGKGWFKGSDIGIAGTLGLANVTSIDEEAFAGAKIPELAKFGFGGTTADKVFEPEGTGGIKNPPVAKTGTTDVEKAVLTIGKAAFKGAEIEGTTVIALDPLKWVTSISDEAFAGIKTKKQAVTGISGFAYVTTLGKDVFKGDTLYWMSKVGNPTTEITGFLTDTDKPAEGATILTLPFETYLTTAPAGILDGVVLVGGFTNDPTTGNTDYNKRDTLVSRIFKFTPSKLQKGIDKDALYNATVYVDYKVYEDWKAHLEGSVVKAYGLKDIANGGVKLVTGMGAEVGKVESKTGIYKISYGFNDDGETTRILSFADAVDPKKSINAAHYKIQGPASAQYLFPEELNTPHEIVKDKDGSFGITLAGGIPAGVYIITTGKVEDPKTSTPAAVLYVEPIDLSLVKIDTLTRTYVGEENLAALLSGIKLSDITVRDLYDEDDIKPVTASDVRLFPTDKTPVVGTPTEVLTMRGLGNYTGSAPVILKYEPLDLSKAEIWLNDVEFTGNAKSYGYPEDDTVYVKSHGFDVKLTQNKDAEDFVDLEFTAPAKIGMVDVTVTANGESENVKGVGKTTYTVLATWAKMGAVNEKVGYNLGETVLFNGLPKTFEGLVQPIYLEEGDYSLVAIPAQEGTLYYVKDLGEYVEGELTEVGEYDFYIIPTSEEFKTIYAGKKDATLVGTLSYKALPLDTLKKAFKPFIGEEGYELSVNESVYAGEYSIALNGDGADFTSFTVTLPEAAVAGIEGLEEPTFEIAIPTALPTELHFDQPLKTLYTSESYDLAQHLTPNEGAKLDFLDDIEWTSSKETKFTVDETGFITAIEEWEGRVTATVKGTEVSATIDIHVIKEGEDKPTSVIAASAAKSVTYADGKLTVKGYAGQTAKLYRLNGTAVAQVNVSSDAATFDVKLTKGFYLVKTGAAVTKIVVR
jgi:hypothetical protein